MENYGKDLILLKNEQLRLEISPRVGASIYSFQGKVGGNWVDIMRPTPEIALVANEPGQFSSFNMIPYSNRIANGILMHKAHTYQLAINNLEGHAIHGEVRDRPWTVVSQSDTMVELEFVSTNYEGISWPFWFKATLTYILDQNKFIVSTRVENLSDQEMPTGMGIHPYFVRSLTKDDDQVMLQMPVKGIYPGDTPLPTGSWEAVPDELNFSVPRDLPTTFVDNCFRATRQHTSITWVKSKVRLTLGWSDVYKHIILYCPTDDSRYFAIEPVTNCNNGFNLANQGVADTGTVYLQPGENLSGQIVMTLDTL